MANDEFLLTLKNANPIETVIGSYVQLKKRGRNFVCNCPFHSEKTPSFTVFTDTQSFYCFGCGAGGDIFTFVEKAENLDFTETIKLLAQRSGLEVPERSGKSSQLAHRKTRIYEMNRIAARFFYNKLVKGSDKSGLKYFVDRKLSPATIKKYGLGFSPNSWDELVKVLRSEGYSEEEIIDAWLGGRSAKNGRMFDMFRNRVMFPIIDLRGNVIGFGGRVLDDSKPKYLNTGATPVFDKGNNLFSLNHAKNSDSKRLILCEGYMDVIAVNQAGFENVVATLGTAITPDQARLISHYAEEVVIAYDSDGAGQAATRKAITHFSAVGLQTRILRMEGAKDPDEYIKKFGAQRFRHLIDDSNDANNFMLDRCEDGLDVDTEAGKVELLNRVSRFLAEIDSPIEREVYISRTAKKYDFPLDVLRSVVEDMIRKKSRSQQKNEWRNIKSTAAHTRDELNPEAAKFKKEANAEELIICYLLRRTGESDQIAEDAPPDSFVTSFNKKVYTAILNGIKNSDQFDLSLLGGEFSPDEMGKIRGMEVKNRAIPITPPTFSECAAVLKKHRPVSNDLSDDDLRNMFSQKKK